MAAKSEAYAHVNSAWKGACKVILGQEVGELSDFEPWLLRYLYLIKHAKSSLSGKDLTITGRDFAPGSRFIRYDEVDFSKKFSPLSINDVKDIDSIASAVSERAVYTTNVVLGKSSFVEGSGNVTDGNFIYNCELVVRSKYSGCAIMLEGSEYCFGNLGARECSFAINTMGGKIVRCFECPSAEEISDCYYGGSLRNCTDCMFCFGVENGRHMVGNIALPKEKYFALKLKLLSEIAQKLKKDKKIFSLFDIIEKARVYPHEFKSSDMPKISSSSFDISPINDAFSKTTEIVFGKPLSTLASYSSLLQKHVPRNIYFSSPFSGAQVIIAGYRTNIPALHKLDGRMLPEEEVRAVGKKSIPASDVEKIKVDLDALVSILHPIAYSDLNKIFGEITNVSNSAVLRDSADCYEGSAYIFSKRCSHCFWPLDSENLFGCYATFKSSFCINSHYSERLARCFEVDGCKDCSDGYFLHNCENVRNSMFCFNSKNLANAIGNSPLAPEQYKKIKSSIISQIASELEKNKDIKYDIYNIGAIRN